MISIADRPKLKSMATFTNVLAVGGFMTLLGSLLLPYFKPEFTLLAYGLMGGGLLLSIVGIYLANRWVRPPRPETVLDQALKKFPDSFRLYHYSGLPCRHILLTPYGVILFHAINWEGVFSYKNGHWKEKINFGRAIRYPLEQHLGNPIKDAQIVENDMREILKSSIGELNDLRFQSMIIFLHPKTRLEVENPTIPVCMIDGLRKKIPVKGERLPEALYQKIQAILDSRFSPQRELKV